MTTVRFAAAILATTAFLGLGGCAGAPSPEPTSTTGASASATATAPSPTPEPTLASITIHSDRVVATDQNGAELASFPFSTTAPSVVAAFTEWFGFAPTKEESNRDVPTDGFSGTVYTWNGFSISWFRGWEDEPGSGASTPPFAAIRVRTTVASVGTVTIQGADGLRVGDTVELDATYPDTHAVIVNYDGAEIGQGWSDCTPIAGTGVLDSVNCVVAVLQPSSGPVTAISAPYPANWGL